MSKVLVTGSAGFIGMHTVLKLQSQDYEVVGIDNLNTYYSVELKLNRLKQQGIDVSKIQYNKEIAGNANILFSQIDITDYQSIENLFSKHAFKHVIHLAAQAGVRYSIENPHAYVDSNVKGFLNILEVCAQYKTEHLIYASSSSVYGTNTKVPFSETDQTDAQVSLYAATKKANESMAHSYSSIYGLRTTGLRFFTVYGPWGRPDMALFKFTRKILNNEPIDIYNNGQLSRDFTYIDDIINGISTLTASEIFEKNYVNIFNVGNGSPIKLMDFVAELEHTLKLKAKFNLMPMQLGDVSVTFADTSKLQSTTGYLPTIDIKQGVKRFVDWYKDYYQ